MLFINPLWRNAEFVGVETAGCHDESVGRINFQYMLGTVSEEREEEENREDRKREKERERKSESEKETDRQTDRQSEEVRLHWSFEMKGAKNTLRILVNIISHILCYSNEYCSIAIHSTNVLLCRKYYPRNNLVVNKCAVVVNIEASTHNRNLHKFSTRYPITQRSKSIYPLPLHTCAFLHTQKHIHAFSILIQNTRILTCDVKCIQIKKKKK